MGWIDIVGGNELDSFGAKVGEYRRTDESDDDYRIRLRAAASDAADQVARPNEGGQAFPLGASKYGGHGPQAGMSLRDYFAAKAMQAIYSNDEALMRRVKSLISNTTEVIVSEEAYRIADAMIAERAK